MKSLKKSAYEQICKPDNIWQAYLRTRKGKRRTLSSATFEIDADQHLHNIEHTLTRQIYSPKPYRVVLIHDPKLRPIVIPDFRDRVIHQAIYGVVAGHYQRSYIDQSYACLPNRGTHKAILQYLKSSRRYKYRLSLDIARYFPSIDHQILRSLLFRQTNDNRLRRLFHIIIKNTEGLYLRKIFRQIWENPPTSKYVGLPIGTLMSQWWANLYLNGFDHFVKRTLKISAYQRYMDDFTLFSDSDEQLRAAHLEIKSWLWHNRKLHLNPKYENVAETRFPSIYLGYRVSKAGLCMGPMARKRLKQKLKRLKRSRISLDHLTSMLTSYSALVRFGK